MHAVLWAQRGPRSPHHREAKTAEPVNESNEGVVAGNERCLLSRTVNILSSAPHTSASHIRRAESNAQLLSRSCPLCATVFHSAIKDKIVSERMRNENGLTFHRFITPNNLVHNEKCFVRCRQANRVLSVHMTRWFFCNFVGNPLFCVLQSRYVEKLLDPVYVFSMF